MGRDAAFVYFGGCDSKSYIIEVLRLMRNECVVDGLRAKKVGEFGEF